MANPWDLKLNPEWFLPGATELEGALKKAAEAAAAAAQEAWNVSQPHPYEKGNYSSSFIVRRSKVEAANGTPRFQVVNTDWKANFLEFGTAVNATGHPTPAFAPLRRSAEAVGLQLVSDKQDRGPARY